MEIPMKFNKELLFSFPLHTFISFLHQNIEPSYVIILLTIPPSLTRTEYYMPLFCGMVSGHQSKNVTAILILTLWSHLKYPNVMNCV